MAHTAKMIYNLFTCTGAVMLSDLLIELRIKPSLFWLKHNLPDKVPQVKLGVKTHMDSVFVCVLWFFSVCICVYLVCILG